MIPFFGHQIDACALAVILSVMPHPGLTQNLLTKTSLKVGACKTKIIFGIGVIRLVLVVFERMRGCT